MKVMVPPDGSENSHRALSYIVDRPWTQEDEFLIVSVIALDKGDVSIAQAMTNPVVAFLVDTEKLLADAKEKLSSVLEGHTVRTSDLSGPVIESLINCAKAYGADLIVMGSEGRTGISRLILSSVAEGVLRHAPCSVQIVRRKKV